jgi:hypothetical protein
MAHHGPLGPSKHAQPTLTSGCILAAPTPATFQPVHPLSTCSTAAQNARALRFWQQCTKERVFHRLRNRALTARAYRQYARYLVRTAFRAFRQAATAYKQERLAASQAEIVSGVGHWRRGRLMLFHSRPPAPAADDAA